ncbi:MAG TPA: BTAD domain-containing putative transcriptional regulator [Acidimicrobiales bacterium]|nr:BTAD domain-containing putative transcriptional regulator [Acidimicrobiales bacterium]
MQSLRVRLLGELQVEGCDPAELGRRQQRTLLKILALHHGRPVSVDHLTECLWGDAAPARASDQLSVLVSRLRSVLGPERIERTDAGYRLRLDWLDLDALADYATEAEHRLGQGRVVAARTAAAAGIALVRGRLLADEGDPWWAAPESATAEQWLRRLRHALLEASARSGDWMVVEHQARDLLGPDPFDEVAVRALMTALAGSGRAASALAAYARFRELLAEDLGVSPEADTEELHTAILRGTPTDVPHPTEDPTRVMGTRSRPELPGRASSLRQLDALLEESSGGSCRLCVVEGEAGIGKTRLLRTWAEGLGELPVSVAFVTCDEMGQVLPLQPVLDLVAALDHMPRAEGVGDVLGPDAPVLGPLLGTNTEPTRPSVLAALTEPGTGQSILHGALTGAIRRAAQRRAVVLIVDDVHLADTATVRWLSLAAVHIGDAPVLLVVSTRPEEGLRLPGAALTLTLDPLDLHAARAIVGAARADDLLARSGGNALFLTELAAWDTGEPGATEHFPDSIRSAVEERCALAGEAATTLRTSAVIGPDVDLDVLAGVTGAPPGQLLTHLEEGVRRRFLVEDGPRFAFAHALVREALASTVGAARAAYIHREAAKALAARPGADPLAVAGHARLGGDVDTASAMLVAAAHIAITRFDADEALRLLDGAIALHETAAGRVERARVLTMLERHDDATRDLEAARTLGAGPETLEVAAWSAHFRRRFGEALLLADQGARDADSDELRMSCLSLGGWVALASGDLGGSESRLERALATAPEGGTVLAESWLAWLRASQGRPDETLDLVHVSQGSGLAVYRYPDAYALMAATMAHAMLARPDHALIALGMLESAIERMDAARWIPRPLNLRGWILRSLGEADRADDLNEEAIERSRQQGLAEPLAHGLLDLAAGRLMAGDADAATRHLEAARLLEAEEHAFRWRHQLRRRLLQVRHDLVTSDLEAAVADAAGLARDAAALGAPRHELQARLLGAMARHQAGLRCAPEEVDALLLGLDRLAGLESWWLTAEVAECFAVARWRALAAQRAADLASSAGPFASSLRRAAADRLS